MVVVSFVFFCPNARGTMSRRIWKRLAFPNTMKSLKTIGEQKSSGNISGNIIALEVAWPLDRRLDRRPSAYTTMHYTNRQPLPFTF